MSVRAAAALAAAVVAGAAPAASAAPPAASFAQLAGEPGCLLAEGYSVFNDAEDEAPPPGCGSSPALLTPSRIVAAPDGAQVAVVGSGGSTLGTNGVTIMQRDGDTGALRFGSCITDDGGDGRVGSPDDCTDGDALSGASGLAFSPDGRFAYTSAAGASTVAWFARDPDTGALTQRGCISGAPGLDERCGIAKALWGASDVLVSRDGATVYVAARRSGAIAVFARDPGTGALAQRGCASAGGSDGACVRVPTLARVSRLALGPGRGLYAASAATGALVSLDADAATGELTAADCVVADAPSGGSCHPASLLSGGIADLAVSPDARDAIAAANADGTLVVFRRDAAGHLSQRQCLQNASPQGADAVDDSGDDSEVSPGCDGAKALSGYEGLQGVAMSADGRGVFAVGDGELAAFERDPATGELTQFGCAESELSYRSCGEARGLGSAVAAAASPDARNVYVASANGDVAVFGSAVAITSRRATAARDHTIRIRLACPAARREGCAGRVSAGAKARSFRLAAGRGARLAVRLPARVLRHHRRARVRVTARDSRRPFGAAQRIVAVRR